MLNNSQNLLDSRIPPSNRLEKLNGNLKDFYSIRINNQWRIIFIWNNGNASNFEIIDYNEIMKKPKNIHPGEVLTEEFLIPLEISPYRLAKNLNIPQTRISEITKGNRRITADTALRLGQYFGNSAKFWLGIQDDFDIEDEFLIKKSILESIKPFVTKKVA